MERENCELLFEYLRSILYDQKIEKPDLDNLDEPYKKLGLGLEYLQQAVEEMLEYSAELSKGNLSGKYPSRENFLCVNLKNLHAHLNHLTWQAKQVAAGDYSQHVSYLGEFSEAFNTMTSQLKERERLLKEETEKVRSRAEVIEGYNELLTEMTRKRKEWILAVDMETKEIIFCNKGEDDKRTYSISCGMCRFKLDFRDKIVNWHGNEQYKVWETADDEQKFYRVTSFQMEWRGRNSYVHIIEDITDDKRTATNLESKAYFDPGTGIHNRLFFEEHMKKLLKNKADFTLCYLDMDGLKYVNDRYGHNEGDSYINAFVSLIQESFRGTDVFARVGGDEFCIVMQGGCGEAMLSKMPEVVNRFMEHNKKEYPVSFSYGVVEIKGNQNTLTLEGILNQADSQMYKCKEIHKKQYDTSIS